MGLPCVNSESIDRLGIENGALTKVALRLIRRVILHLGITLNNRVPPRVFGVFAHRM
jgi:hypothetical protein